ncbi:MAG: DUF167 domain-containing protein [Betaproteobacteria bacterium]|nr:DUF167 domain-containing protein [Betaproteobacteria bacterium]
MTADGGTWWKSDPAGGKITLTLHVQPNARQTAVVGCYGDALKLKIAAPAVDDKANRAVIDFLHQWFKLSTTKISIRHGSRSRRKIVELAHCDADTMKHLARLESSCPAN